MKILIFPILLILLSSCVGERMTRQEIIEAVKECEDAGMRAVLLKYGGAGAASEVTCDLK